MGNTSKKVKKAVEQFRNPYSCAQTIYASFSENPIQEMFDYMKANSGGKCEGGLCGALFAAKTFVDDSKKEDLEKFFEEKVGAKTCREIKMQFKTPCPECVRIAALGVENFK